MTIKAWIKIHNNSKKVKNDNKIMGKEWIEFFLKCNLDSNNKKRTDNNDDCDDVSNNLNYIFFI